jgi:Fe-S-cluster-containing dehydrogenase component/formate-dependent nitrite reductase membrane component NrfD
VRLGFILDKTRCIGCHACTVACKSENGVALGNFRTWVKYTETGQFPEVSRSFTVLRCNQCSDAPCMEICPTSALFKRPDGIVDLDHRVCIGCKGCMQACPYDAIHIEPDTGTAAKCHFCAHRLESGLAPACAVVCPTEAIIPGDFDDPTSLVSIMSARETLTVRKPEAGTKPNVFYRDADPAGLNPLATSTADGFLWSQQLPGPRLDADLFRAAEAKACGTASATDDARTTYDVPRPITWGAKVSAYLFTKSIAAGIFLAGLPLLLSGDGHGVGTLVVPVLALLFLVITAVLLVADLQRPDRFLMILRRPNFRSWLALGSIVLGLYGLLLVPWLLSGMGWIGSGGPWLAAFTGLAACVTAAYTAWLLQQAKGRPYWMHRLLAPHLVVQALVAGSALCVLLGAAVLPFSELQVQSLRGILGLSLVAHGLFNWTHGMPRFFPAGREEECKRAHALLTRGPLAHRHRVLGTYLGIILPVFALLFLSQFGGVVLVAAILALIGLASEEDLFIRAGQAIPIS